MLKHRLITGPLLIAMLLGVMWFDNWLDTVELTGYWKSVFNGKHHPPRGMALFIMSLLASMLAALEMANIFRMDNISVRPWLTAFAAMLGVSLSYCVPVETPVIVAIAIVSTGMIVVFVASLLTFSQQRNVEGVAAAAGAVMFTMVYIGFMMGFLLAIRRGHSAWWIVGIVLLTKTCDSGAFFTGRAIGKRKLIPWLSPGKTWEGLFGGILSSILAGILLAWLSGFLPATNDHVPLWLGALCGLVFAIVGQFGDLTMSLFKRGAGLKDSSTLLPGLGGVMDVLDSPLMVAPVAYWLLKLTAPPVTNGF